MVEPITINIRHLSQDVGLPQEQVQAAIDLLDAGFPVPFIARYRKEATNNLSEEMLRQIDGELRSARVLCERKQTILKTTDAAGKLTPALEKMIREAKSMKRLEDIYLPFKPKRKNAAFTARENGLEPFALEILEGTLPADKIDERAAEFINEDKKIKSVADVLLGAGHIIADMFGCKAELVHKVRESLYQHGYLTTTKIGEIPVDRKAGGKPKTEIDGRQQKADGSRETSGDAGNVTDAGNPEELPVPPELETTETTETAPSETPSSDEAVKTDEAVETPETECTDGAAGEEGAAAGTQESEGEQEAEEKDASETSGTDDSLSPSADSPLPSAELSEESSDTETSQDGTQEVTALFEQLKEVQAEKGLPVVKSQNALKKKKKAEAKKKQDDIKQRQREHFERQFTEYFQYSTKLRGIPAHRILSVNRGERHRIIQVAIQINEEKVLESVKEVCVPPDHVHAEFLTGCLRDALHKGMLPTLIQEIRNDMTEYAEKTVIKTFGKHLRNQLLMRPFLHKRVLALEPSGKNGCRAAALDEFGNLLGHETVLFSSNIERNAGTEKTLTDMIHRFNLVAVAIGIGGGARTAEETVAHMIETHFADSDLAYVMINKSGLTSYSTSAAAKAEFPNEDVYVRTAVSIGRRLQDPLSELVKVEPINLGIGVLHHETSGKYPKQALDVVVESCVNLVGVDLNRATVAMLTHVAGLNPMTARRIYEYRREHGAFRYRADLKKVSGITETVYTHAVGFLKISGGDHPLDATNIHPESYELAANVLEKLGFSVNDLQKNDNAITDKIAAERMGELAVKLASELGAGILTVRDILENLAKPNRDPRESQPPLMFRKTALKFENLTPGVELVGTILNVTDFGAFVDIGLHESGFLHVSQMAAGYIRNPHEKVAVGDTVRLWVVETDAAKKRISLTLLPPGTIKQTHKSEDKEREKPPRERSPRPPRPVGGGGGGGGGGERREFSGKPREGQSHPPREGGGDRVESRDGRRFDRRPGGGGGRGQSGGRSFERAPKTFVTAPVKKDVKPITEKMKQGKEPMRSFGDLAQLFGRVQVESEEGKDGKK